MVAHCVDSYYSTEYLCTCREWDARQWLQRSPGGLGAPVARLPFLLLAHQVQSFANAPPSALGPARAFIDKGQHVMSPQWDFDGSNSAQAAPFCRTRGSPASQGRALRVM